MMDTMVFWTAVCAIAIGNSVFFGVYLWYLKPATGPHKLLSLLLFALAVRIGKSAVIIFVPNAPDIVPAIGLVGMAAIGPFAWLHIRSMMGVFNRKITALWHFAPAALIVLFLPFSSEGTIYFFYVAIVCQLIVYLLAAAVFAGRHRQKHPHAEPQKRWCNLLIAGLLIIALSFVYQLFADSYFSYALSTALAVVVLYGLGYWSMSRRNILTSGVKIGSVTDELRLLAAQLENLFRRDKIHTQENVSLREVASRLNCPPYLVSKAINEVFHMRFPEYLNNYRIEEARAKLEQDRSSRLSIETIAYESGFSTLSSFYSTFKKTVKMTPAEYRRKLQQG